MEVALAIAALAALVAAALSPPGVRIGRALARAARRRRRRRVRA